MASDEQRRSITERLRTAFELRHAGLIAVCAAAGYLLFPGEIAKLFFLFLLGYGIASVKCGRVLALLPATAAIACFALSFIFTPVGYFFLGPPGQRVSSGSLILTNAALVLGGAGYAGMLAWLSRPIRLRRRIPGWTVFILLIGLVVVLYGPAIFADLSYGGDEYFHVTSTAVYRKLIFDLFTQIPSLLLLLLTFFCIAGAVWTLRHKQQQQHWRFLLFTSGLAIILCAAVCSPFLYPETDLINPAVRWRAARFPVPQAWISAALIQLMPSNWGVFQHYAPGMAAYRLLPVAGIMVLATALVGGRSWQKTPLLACVAILPVLTIPNLRFHGTVLYLDIAVCTAVLIALLDSRRLLTGTIARLPQTCGWWCLVFAGYLKESALPYLLMFLVGRFMVQAYMLFRGKRRPPGGKEILRELANAAVILAPIILYLVIRSSQQDRPYGMQLMNLVNLRAWLKSMYEYTLNTGPFVILTLGGAIWLAYRRRWIELLACGAAFVGIKAFFLGDSLNYIGLPRFDLYLLPPTIVLAWYGIRRLRQKPPALIAICLFVAAFNLWFSPVTLTGSHRPWRGTDTFYPYRECLSYMQENQFDGKLLLANMPSEHGIGVVFVRLRWLPPPETEQLPPQPGLSVERQVHYALAYAKEHGYHGVVFRYEDDPPYRPPIQIGPYRLVNNVPSRFGVLLVFISTNGGQALKTEEQKLNSK